MRRKKATEQLARDSELARLMVLKKVFPITVAFMDFVERNEFPTRTFDVPGDTTGKQYASLDMDEMSQADAIKLLEMMSRTMKYVADLYLELGITPAEYGMLLNDKSVMAAAEKILNADISKEEEIYE